MTREEKYLVLRDLCARLPYGVKLKVREWKTPVELTIIKHNVLSGNYIINGNYKLDDIKPYLRPRSSMTEEENFKYRMTLKYIVGMDGTLNWFHETIQTFEWLLEHHFDFCGLIEKGSALEAPEGMYKKGE